MSQAAGWYPDPAGSGRQRYFDGVQWTESYAQTYTTVYAAPTPVDTTPKPAGWYPDPRGGRQRRYWDGTQWTEHLTEPEILLPNVKPETSRGLLVVGVMAGVLFVAAVFGALKEGKTDGAGALIGGLIVLSVIGWGIRLAFRSDAKRKKRQQELDRQRALAIQADIQDAAFIQGDDVRGMYGQFPPPPELLDDDR